jgi:hypothetical protein
MTTIHDLLAEYTQIAPNTRAKARLAPPSVVPA